MQPLLSRNGFLMRASLLVRANILIMSAVLALNPTNYEVPIGYVNLHWSNNDMQKNGESNGQGSSNSNGQGYPTTNIAYCPSLYSLSGSTSSSDSLDASLYAPDASFTPSPSSNSPFCVPDGYSAASSSQAQGNAIYNRHSSDYYNELSKISLTKQTSCRSTDTFANGTTAQNHSNSYQNHGNSYQNHSTTVQNHSNSYQNHSTAVQNHGIYFESSAQIDDANADYMTKAYYTTHYSPVYWHLVKEEWLLDEVIKGETLEIYCPKCKKLVNPRALVEHVRMVALKNPQGATLKDTAHILVNYLIRKLISNFGVNFLLFSLGIEDHHQLGKFKTYCEGIPKEYRVLGIDGLIELLDGIVSHMRNKAVINTNPGKMVPPKSINGRGHFKTYRKHKHLYVLSLDFTRIISDGTVYENYVDIIEKCEIGLKSSYFQALIVFLLNNPNIQAGFIVSYLIPHMIHDDIKSNSRIDKFIDEFRKKYGTVESKEELNLECMMYTKHEFACNVIDPFMTAFLRHKNISMERILNFILRNAPNCDIDNRSDSVMVSINWLADNLISCRNSGMTLKDLLKIESIIKTYPMHAKLASSLTALRNNYLFNHKNILIDLKPEIVAIADQILIDGKLVPLNGLFAVFTYYNNTCKWRAFFELFCAVFTEPDMKMFYLPGLAEYKIISANGLSEIMNAYNNVPRLKIAYINGLLLYLCKKLACLKNESLFQLLIDPEDTELKSTMEKLRSFVTLFEAALIADLSRPGHEEIMVTFGLMRYYNVLLDMHYNHLLCHGVSRLRCDNPSLMDAGVEILKIKIRERQLESLQYESIFIRLCMCYVASRLPIYRDALLMMASSVFEVLSKKDIVDIYQTYFNRDEAYLEILRELYVDYCLRRDRVQIVRNQQGRQIAIENSTAEDIQNKIVLMIKAYNSIAYSSGGHAPANDELTQAGPAQLAGCPENKLGFKSAEAIRAYLKHMRNYISTIGYEVHQSREIYYWQIHPLICGHFMNQAIPLVQKEMNLKDRNIQTQNDLYLFTLQLLLGDSPIVPDYPSLYG